MFGSSVRIGRILGIEIRVDYSWFIVFVLVTWSLAGQYFPSAYPGWSNTAYWLLGALTAVLFFLSVLAHELAHSVVSQAARVPVRNITLFIFGGAAQISDEPRTAGAEFWMALVGPLTSLAIAAVSGVVWFVSRMFSPYLYALAGWLGMINLSLALFNLIPGFPLDGGRIFRALVWGLTGNLRQATRIATNLGRLVAYGFILWGVAQLFSGNWVNGVWIAFIGWFLDNAATASYRRVALRELLAGHTAREVMTRECQWIPPGLTLDTLIEQVILPTGRRCFPVQEGGKLQGLLTLHRISQVPRYAWKDTRVEDVMIPRAELKTVRPDDELDVIFDRMTSEDVNQFLVLDADELLGMVARDNLLNFIRIRSDLGL
ncbi:MAG: site-2 protease family protein [Anaerolineae bacterium]